MALNPGELMLALQQLAIQQPPGSEQPSSQRPFQQHDQQNQRGISFFSSDNGKTTDTQAGTKVGLREEQLNAYDNLEVEQQQSLERLNRDWPYFKGRPNHQHQSFVQQHGNHDGMGNLQIQQSVQQNSNYGGVVNHEIQYGVQQNSKYGCAVNHQFQQDFPKNSNYGRAMNHQSQHGVQQLRAYQGQHGVRQRVNQGQVITNQAQHSHHQLPSNYGERMHHHVQPDPRHRGDQRNVMYYQHENQQSA